MSWKNKEILIKVGTKVRVNQSKELAKDFNWDVSQEYNTTFIIAALYCRASSNIELHRVDNTGRDGKWSVDNDFLHKYFEAV